MASEVDIANMALSLLGEKPSITALIPPDQSKYAGDAARFYPIARGVTLESYAWSFATKQVVLAAVTSDEEAWEFMYAIPSDMKRAIALLDSGTPEDDPGHPFVIRGQRLYCNVEDAELRYVYDCKSTNLFSSWFEYTVALMLASLLAGPVLKSAKMSDAMMAKFRLAIGEAATKDANTTSKSRPSYTPGSVAARGA